MSEQNQNQPTQEQGAARRMGQGDQFQVNALLRARLRQLLQFPKGE